jgi:hypothetical protein
MKWAGRVLMAAIAVFVVLYGSDWAIYKLRGSPQGKVTVNRYLSIPLKGNKQEIDYLGTEDEPCARALFSQGGQLPCWQLRRNHNLGATM